MYLQTYLARCLAVSDDAECHRPFENEAISIAVFLSSVDQCPYFLMRTLQADAPWFSLFGAHELCIEREGSALQLKRWSRSADSSKLWAALYFQTWEGKPIVTACEVMRVRANDE